jgi:hypothetical protein
MEILARAAVVDSASALTHDRYDRGRYGIFPNRKMLVQHPATVTINVDRSSSFSMCAASGAPPEVSKWSAGAIFAPPRIEPRMQTPFKELWLALHARRLRPINRYNGMLRTRNSPSHMAADFILGREPNRKIKPIIRKEVAVAPRTPGIIPSALLLLETSFTTLPTECHPNRLYTTSRKAGRRLGRSDPNIEGFAIQLRPAATLSTPCCRDW